MPHLLSILENLNNLATLEANPEIDLNELFSYARECRKDDLIDLKKDIKQLLTLARQTLAQEVTDEKLLNYLTFRIKLFPILAIHHEWWRFWLGSNVITTDLTEECREHLSAIEEIPAMVNSTPKEAESSLSRLSNSFSESGTELVLRTSLSKLRQLNMISVDTFLSLAGSEDDKLRKAFEFLQQNDLLDSNTILALLIINKSNSDVIVQALTLAKDNFTPSLLSYTFALQIMQSGAFSIDVVKSFENLRLAEPSLLTEDKIKLLFKKAPEAKKLSWILYKISEFSPSLLPDYMKALNETDNIAGPLANIIYIFAIKNSSLLNENILCKLCSAVSSSLHLFKILKLIFTHSPSAKLSDETLTTLLDNADNAKAIAGCLELLGQELPSEFLPTWLESLLAISNHAPDVLQIMQLIKGKNIPISGLISRILVALIVLPEIKNIKIIINCLDKATPSLLTAENIDSAFKDVNKAVNVAEALTAFGKYPKTLTQEITNILFANREFAKYIAEIFLSPVEMHVPIGANMLESQIATVSNILQKLGQHKPSLVNKDTLALLKANKKYYEELSDALNLLNEVPLLFSDKNIIPILENGQFSFNIAAALHAFDNHAPDLLTDVNLNILVKNAEYADNIATAWIILKNSAHALFTGENIALVNAHPTYSHWIAATFELLCHANPESLYDTYRNQVIDNISYLTRLVPAFEQLLIAAMLTAPNIDRLFENKELLGGDENNSPLGDIFMILNELNPQRLDDHVFDLLLTNVAHVSKIAEAMKLLKDNALLTDDNLALLYAHSQYSFEIAKVLVELNLAKPSKLTATNIGRIRRNASSASSLADIFFLLRTKIPELFTDGIIETLFEIAENGNIARFAAIVDSLNDDPPLFSQANFAKVFLLEKHWENLGIVFNTLRKNVPSLLDNEEVDYFVNNPKMALILGPTLVELNEWGLLNPSILEWFKKNTKQRKNFFATIDFLKENSNLSRSLIALSLLALYKNSCHLDFNYLWREVTQQEIKGELKNAQNKNAVFAIYLLGRIAAGEFYFRKEDTTIEPSTAIYYYAQTIRSNQNPYANYAKEDLAGLLGWLSDEDLSVAFDELDDNDILSPVIETLIETDFLHETQYGSMLEKQVNPGILQDSLYSRVVRILKFENFFLDKSCSLALEEWQNKCSYLPIGTQLKIGGTVAFYRRYINKSIKDDLGNTAVKENYVRFIEKIYENKTVKSGVTGFARGFK
jgi:hypothetical protein